MATPTSTKPTTLRALEELFAEQLLKADSPYLESRNVVLQMRVPIPNTGPTREEGEGEVVGQNQRQSDTYAYTHLDITVPTKLFLASEGEWLQAQGTGLMVSRQQERIPAQGTGLMVSRQQERIPAQGFRLARTVRKAIREAAGVEARVRKDGSIYYGDSIGPGVEVFSVQMVEKGDVDLANEKGYHALLVSPKEAEGRYPAQQPPTPVPTFDSKAVNPEISWDHPCRYFLPADYTIYLRSDDEGEEGGGGRGGKRGGIVSTFHVNRFLLGLRIPYFRNMFSSGMADSGTDSSTLYTDTFSPEALTIICRYIYLIRNPQEPRNLFWFCGISGQSDDENEALLRRLRNYIYLDQLDAIGSFFILPSQKPCTDPIKGSPPPVSIVTHLINVVKAADYLGLDDLKSYITYTLTELAHNFDCWGSGCAVLLPKMLDKVYHEPIVPRSLLDSLVKMLGRTKAVQSLWKRSLIMMSPEAISHLLTHIQNRILHSPVAKRTNEGGGTLAAFVLYVALAKLHRQVRGKSRDAERWEEKLLDPLMKDFLTKLLAADLSWCEYLVSRGAAGLDIDITQGLVRGIASRLMARENCEKIWRVVSNRELEFWDEHALKSAVEWFKKQWLSLSVTPPEPDPRTSARPPGGAEVAAVMPQKKMPRMKEAYEPNFFATWDRRDLDLLGREVGVEVEDLLAQGHRAGLPPMTPRRSVGMGERGRRIAPEGSGGGAVIPPVGAGGGRTGQSGGATLLNAPGGSLEGEDDMDRSRDGLPPPAATTARVRSHLTTTQIGRGVNIPRPGTTDSTAGTEQETP